MRIHPDELRTERYPDVAEAIRRDSELLIERWSLLALETHPNTDPARHAEMRNSLPDLLEALADALGDGQVEGNSRCGLLAVEHGEQRWQVGWQVTEVVQDYQLLRLVILDHLGELPGSPLTVRSAMAICSRLDEAIGASVATYSNGKEQTLRELIERADEANRAKSEFLAKMSHEIRSPMTSIVGFTEYLLNEPLEDPEHREAVGAVRRNGQYLLEIVNDILDLSKIESGKFEVEPARTSPFQLLRDIESTFRAAATERGLEFSIQVDDPLPETILTDAVRLRQILVNLIGNALKFTHEGSVRLEVRLVRQARERQLEMLVVDTGIGMSGDQLAQLFQPFTQFVQNSGKYGGTGLGLTICKSLAQMLGGSLEAESEQGVGSRFRLRIATGSLDGIACHRWEEVPATIEETLPPTEPAIVNLAGARILVADDRRDSRYLVCKLLEDSGAEVVAVEDGQLAVEAFERHRGAGTPIELILLDMQMPVINGYQATAELRTRGCDVAIIALTASAMREDRDKCLEAGCDDYLAKPISRQSLLETAQRHLRR